MNKLIPIILLIPSILQANNEDFHVRNWCKHGTVEAVQLDKTRVDCLTEDYAIEFDWASKYNEAIGQSLGYAIRTGKRPGIVLIIKKPSDIKYWNRLQEIIIYYRLPIQTWKMKEIKDNNE